MADYIAHASLGSNGKTKGDKAGDQGREVCIRTWYNKPFQYVLRIMNEEVRIQFANNMIDIANNNKVGYDQNGRNTLLAEAKKVDFDFTKIKTACECDCSSMVTTALLGAIYKVMGKDAYEKAYKCMVQDGNCARTKNLKNAMLKLEKAIGLVVKVFTSATYVKGTSKALFGDIYNKEHAHVVCFIADGKKRKTTTNSTTDKAPSVKEDNKVLEFQKAAIADGFEFPKFGADGEWGSECESVAEKAIVKMRISKGKNVYKYPNLTKIVQEAVGASVDGQCGAKTDKAIMEYQTEKGLKADGDVGLKTWKKILGV